MEKIDSKENLIRLINQYQNLVFSICLKMTGDYFAAEDLAQETFISAFKNWKNFDGEYEKTWLCRIATNKCIDYKRASARKELALEDEMMVNHVSTSEPLGEIINKDLMNNFEKTLEQLEEPYRSVAKRHFIDGKTAKEISEERNIGLKTIQTQIYRARSMLKQSIRKEDLIS